MTAPVWVAVGHLGKSYGLKGWQFFHSYLEEPLSLSHYADIAVRPRAADDSAWQAVQVEGIKSHGKAYLVKLQGPINPQQASQFCHRQLGVTRDQLPQPASGSYYWSDLIGSRVISTYGGHEVLLGTIDSLQRAGGKDIMIIKGETRQQEIYIPFVQPDFVTKVDLKQGLVRVLWDPDF